MGQPAAELQAVQSRLLSRGGTNNSERQVRANEKVAELTARIVSLQAQSQVVLGEIANNTATPLQVRGR